MQLKVSLRDNAQTAYVHRSHWDSCQCHPVLQVYWITLSHSAKVLHMKTCDKCHGAMLPERAVDLDAGLAITVFACLNCGRRKAADQEPRPITARH
jgi:hypothetical protein